jgi:5'/3'-nucleotidase SurE
MPAAGSLATVASVAALCGTGPLDILLTNDDGVDAAGLQALRGPLVAAGHRVTVAAPDHNASGSAMSFTWGSVRVTHDPDDPAVYSVAATPATAVVLAATALYPVGRRPDLVISGINHGPNAGALLVLSGTVGGALAGTLLLDPPVPGIAVNAERLDAAQPANSAGNRAQLDAAGTHLAKLVGTTRGWFCEDGQVVRARTVLNVNYPARPAAQFAGTVAARQDSGTDLRVGFVPSGDDEYRAQASRSDPPSERNSDRYWLERGYVTVTPVSGAIGDDDAPRRDLERRLRGL